MFLLRVSGHMSLSRPARSDLPRLRGSCTGCSCITLANIPTRQVCACNDYIHTYACQHGVLAFAFWHLHAPTYVGTTDLTLGSRYHSEKACTPDAENEQSRIGALLQVTEPHSAMHGQRLRPSLVTAPTGACLPRLPLWRGRHFHSDIDPASLEGRVGHSESAVTAGSSTQSFEAVGKVVQTPCYLAYTLARVQVLYWQAVSTLEVQRNGQ